MNRPMARLRVHRDYRNAILFALGSICILLSGYLR